MITKSILAVSSRYGTAARTSTIVMTTIVIIITQADERLPILRSIDRSIDRFTFMQDPMCAYS